MIKIVMGLKGNGKTKTLIANVNQSVTDESGDVICIERDSKLRFDVNHKVRLISASEYGIDNYDKFYAFLCGLIAGNYDITAIYVDSIMKICGENMDEFYAFLKSLEKFTSHIKFYMTASYDVEKAPDQIKDYIQHH